MNKSSSWPTQRRAPVLFDNDSESYKDLFAPIPTGEHVIMTAAPQQVDFYNYVVIGWKI